MSNPKIFETNAAIPNAAQLSESRLKQWHQQGEALLTIENLRSWINAAGLVPFAPRPQIVAPAPSLVEAVLGEPNASPTLEQMAEARGLLARLVAEGLAVPLNLLGASGPGMAGAVGETPDFVASTAVFSYVFTLRGDKAWKQPPVTTGALKVSPLALAAHEALTRRGTLSAYDLATELGKEVTEAAVLRALGELWTHLRVLPLAQPDGAATLWELAGTRFVKQIKAGANAGQPSAISALISLYLGQAIVASEEEIESFLSPLAARSRIRDVVHALLAARQLETIAVEGRTVLHVAGELPSFLAPGSAVAAAPEASGDTEAAVEGETADAVEGDAPRITKYVPKPKKIGTGYLAKASPAKFGDRPAGARRPAAKFAAKPGFKSGVKSGPATESERRPFSKPKIDYVARGFDKPWEEEKARRLAAASRPSDVSGDAGDGAEEARAPRTYATRAGGSDRGGKPSFGGKSSFGRKPAFGGKPGFGEKPAFRGKPSFGDGRPPRQEYVARGEGGAGEARPARKTFSKPGTFGRKREGSGGKPAFDAKPSFGDKRAPRREAGERPARPGSRPPREAGGFAGKPYPPRGAGFFSGKPRTADGRAKDASGMRERPERGAAAEGGKRVYRKFDAPRDARPARTSSSASDRPARSARPAAGGFAGKNGGDFGPRRPSGKPGGGTGKTFGKSGSKTGGSFAGKPGSPFAKFADGNKPFGKRPPSRKFKAKEDESA